jgi:hypothetical protein
VVIDTRDHMSRSRDPRLPGLHHKRRAASSDAAEPARSRRPDNEPLKADGPVKEDGRRDWTRTNDPHHVKVVL